jgi:Rhs element Vgr protein
MGIPVATIKSEGTELDPTIEVMSIEIHRELNRIPEATLVLLDGSVAARKFEVSNSVFFALGKKITIALRYEGDDVDTTLFAGLVVRHAVETQPEGSQLRVELKDAAFKLTRQRKSAVFRKQSDDDAIRKLIGDAKLTVGELAATKPKHDELIQYYASDWDFIVARADVQGMVVDVDLGAISVQPMALASEAKLALAYGLGSVSELELELDAGQQWAEVESVGWDLQQQTLTAPEPAKQPSVPVGKAGANDAAAVAKTLGGDKYTLLHPAVLEQPELEAWADARLLRSRLSLLRGRAVVAGDPTLAPLDTVELSGVGDRFNGKALVSAVIQRVDHDGWQTELRLGLPPEWFARQPDIAEVPAGGLLPAITSLQIATVAAFEADPKGEHRIKVKLPALDDQQGFVWARVARPDAGKDRGQVFWPEPEDEVVVGFLDGDPRQAIVLGALHSSAKPPPAVAGAPADPNDKRAIVTRAGSVIAFDDKKKSITIETPGKNHILIDDDAQAITIADQHGNTITMDSKGITLKSASDFMIDAAGKVAIKGSAVDVQ